MPGKGGIYLLVVVSLVWHQSCLGLIPPPDPVVPGWRVARALCAECGDGSTCGQLEETASVYFSDGRKASFGQGTTLTCFEKDYSTDFSATFGGRCVPALPQDLPIESFCEAVQPSNVSGRRLSTVVFQALVHQEKRCGPCCDGNYKCSGDLVCKAVEGSKQPGGVCVHPDHQDECGTEAQDFEDVLCDSCLPDLEVSRRVLTGKDEPVAPGPTPNKGLPYCLQLAAIEKIEDILHYLQSQPWSGRAIIQQLEGILHTIEALIAANFLRGAWGANRQATTSVVVANWKRETAASSKVFRELIHGDPHMTAAMYTSGAHKAHDIGAGVVSASFLSAPAAHSHVFLLACANERVYSAGTMWGLSYKSNLSVSLALFAQAAAKADATGVKNLMGAAVVAQYYTGVSVKATDFAQHAASVGLRQEIVDRIRPAWHG